MITMHSSRSRFYEFRRRYRFGLRRSPPAAQGFDNQARETSAPTATDDGSGKVLPAAFGSVVARSDAVAQVRQRRDRWRYLRDYLTWLRPFAGTMVLIYLLGIAAAGLSLILPWATMIVFDHVLPARNWAALHTFGAVLLVILLVQQGLDFLRNWRTAVLNARVLFRLRQCLFEHLLHLPLHKLADMKTGGITSRLSGDVDAVSGLVQIAVLTPAVAATKIVATIGLLLAIQWQLSLAAALMLPGVVALNILYLRRVRPIYRSMRRDRAEIDGRVVETFGGIRVVRGFQREKTEALRYAICHHTVIRKNLLARFYEFCVWSGWGLLIPLAALVVVWLGGVLVLLGKTTVGSIIAFQMYLMMLLAPVSSIVRSYGEVQHALASAERIFDLLREQVDKPDRPGARPAPTCVERIEFDHVTFGYQPDRPVLHDVSFVVPGGTTVALVGPSGAGKTTVTNLVARFYDPDQGAVRLNGIDLRDLRLRSYRRLLGIVQQDVFLFDGTIAENIAYARPDASREQIEQAARRANAHEFIAAFPEGYDTLVGERGVRLSGGQAQRISIARAILADPQILILDEATSNLDSESERLIQAALAELLADRTTFIIAHRLSTVVNADLIIVLDQGRVVEVGRHEELMAANGLYRAMVERQQQALALEAGAVGAEWSA